MFWRTPQRRCVGSTSKLPLNARQMKDRGGPVRGSSGIICHRIRRDEDRPTMNSMSGHCLCSAVKFTAEKVETHHHICHCGMCRRWAGGPVFGASASGVKFEGEEHITRYASSEWAERGFCSRCG